MCTQLLEKKVSTVAKLENTEVNSVNTGDLSENTSVILPLLHPPVKSVSTAEKTVSIVEKKVNIVVMKESTVANWVCILAK